MKAKIVTYILLVLCAISIGYFIIIIINPHKNTDIQYNKVFDSAGKSIVIHIQDIDDNSDLIATYSDASSSDASKKEFPSSYNITMEYISQYPDLPSGCESVSLTMLLNYHGFDITKYELVDNYLIYSYDYVCGFCGDPYNSYVGGGCFAPGMTDTANSYLTSQSTSLEAHNLTGIDFIDLLHYIADDKPAMVWTTIGLGACEKGYEGGYYDGEYYAWDYMEHCVVLTGYDLNNRTVTVYDPIDGIVTRDFDTFEEIYNQMYKMAIVIE